MKWSDLPINPSHRVLRQFAGAWLVFFAFLGAHQAWVRHHPHVGLMLVIAAVVIGLPGLLRPAAVRWLFVGWMVLAFPVGWLVSQIMLGLLFYGLITPVALLFRLRGRDLLRRKASLNETTFWMEKETPRDLRRYLRQY